MYKNRPNAVLALEVGIRVNFGQEGGRGMLGEHLRCGKVLFLHLDGKQWSEPTL